MKPILRFLFWLSIIFLTLASVSKTPAAPRRETPREVLCTRNGFVIYNGMATGLKKISPNRFTFIDLTYNRGPRTIYGECYAYVEGVWEQPRKGETK